MESGVCPLPSALCSMLYAYHNSFSCEDTGLFLPKYSYARFVVCLPRGVRSRKPSCRRNGSYTSSSVSFSSLIAAARVSSPTGPPPNFSMIIRSSLRSILSKPFRSEERFVHILQRVLLFVDRRGKGIESHRAAAELFNDHQEQPPVHIVEAFFIHFEPLHGTGNHGLRDLPVSLHLRKVPHAPEKTVCDPRRAAGAAGYLGGGSGLCGYAQKLGRALDDQAKFFGRVKGKPLDHAQAVPQRP